MSMLPSLRILEPNCEFSLGKCEERNLSEIFNVFVAMLALERPAKLKPEAVVAELRAQRPDFPGEITITAGASGAGGGVLLTLGSEPVSIMSLDASLPPGTLDRATADNLFWPDSGRIMARHRAHVIVASLRELTDLASRLAAAESVTRVCAAIAKLTSCIGIYWVPSESAIEPGKFQAEAARMGKDNWPISIWVRLHPFKGLDSKDGAVTIGCATMGLSIFVGREIEFEPALRPLGVVAQRVQGTIFYLLAGGRPLKDGDTLGAEATERIRIALADKGRRIDLPIFRLIHEREGAPADSK
jgi:hypothetical protein